MSTLSVSVGLNDRVSSGLKSIANEVNKVKSGLKALENSGSKAANSLANISKASSKINNSVGKTPSLFSRLASSAKTASTSVDAVNRSAEKSPSVFSRMGSAINNCIRMAAGFTIIRRAIDTVMGSVQSALNRIDTMDTFERKMGLITGSTDQATYALDQLKQSTKGTAYSLDTAANAVQNFVTRGMQTDDAVQSVNTWMDVVAAFGKGTNAEFESAMDAIAKMRTKGTVEMRYLNRLFAIGINPVQAYAKVVGRSAADVQTDLSNKKISAEVFLNTVEKAYREGTNGVTQVTGMAVKAGTTWAGVLENMKIAVTRGMVEIISASDEAFKIFNDNGLKGVIKQFGVTIENVLDNIAGAIKVVLPPILSVFKAIYDGLNKYVIEPFKNTLGPVVESLKTLFADLQNTIDMDFVKPLANDGGNAVQSFADTTHNALSNMFPSDFGDTTDGFKQFIGNTGYILARLVNTIVRVKDEIADIFTTGNGTQINPFKDLGDTLGYLSSIGTDIFPPAFSAIGDAVVKIVEAFVRVAPVILEAAENIGKFVAHLAVITVPPALEFLSTLFAEIMDTVSQFVTDTLPKITKGLADLGTKLTDSFGPNVADNAMNIARVLAHNVLPVLGAFMAFKSTKSVFNTLSSVAQTIAGVISSLSFLATPLGIISMLVVGLGVAFAHMILNADDSDTVLTRLGTVVDVLKGAFNNVVNIVLKAGAAFTSFAEGIWDGVSPAIEHATEVLTKFFGARQEKNNAQNGGLSTDPFEEFLDGIESIGERIGTVIGNIITICTNITTAVVPVFDELKNSVSDTFSSLADNPYIQRFFDLINDVCELVGTYAPPLIAALSDAFINIVPALVNAAGAVATFVVEVAKIVVPPAVNILVGICTFIADHANTIIGAILGIVAAFLLFKVLTTIRDVLTTFRDVLVKKVIPAVWGFCEVVGEKGLISAIAGLAKPTTWIFLFIAAIVALGVYLVYLYNTCDDFRRKVNDMFSNMVKPIMSFLQLIGFFDKQWNLTDFGGNILSAFGWKDEDIKGMKQSGKYMQMFMDDGLNALLDEKEKMDKAAGKIEDDKDNFWKRISFDGGVKIDGKGLTEYILGDSGSMMGDMSNTGSQAAGQLGQSYQDTLNSMSTDYQSMTNGATQQGAQTGTDTAQSLTQSYQDALNQVSGQTQTATQNLYGNLPYDAASVGSETGSALAGAITGATGDVAGSAYNLGQAGSSALVNGAGSANTYGAGSSMISDFSQGVTDSMATTPDVGTFSQQISNDLTGGLQASQEFMQGFNANVVNGLSATLNTVRNYAATIKEAIVNTFKNDGTNINTNIFTDLQVSITNALVSIKQMCSNLQTQIIEAKNKAVSAITNLSVNLTSKFTIMQNQASLKVLSLKSEVSKYLAQMKDNGVTIATDFKNAFVNKMTLLKDTTKARISSMVTDVKTKLRELPKEANNVGVDMMTSLKDGIISKKQEVINETSKMVEELKRVFLEGLGINSPSEFGIYVADMLGEGILVGWPQERVEQFFNGVVGNMQSSFEAGHFDANKLVEALKDNTPALIAKLGGVDTSALSNLEGDTFAYPVAGGPYELTSGYGGRESPGGIGSTNHQGIDIGAPSGESILSVLAGTVSFAGYNDGYGNMVKVDHGNGFETLYGHMSEITAETGQAVNKGQQIGLVGSTGNSTGPHLHLSVLQNGDFVDPTPYYEGASVKAGSTMTPLQTTIQNAYNRYKGLSESKSSVGQLGNVDGSLRSVVQAALTLNHQPLTYTDDILNAIQHESGGDPNAINDWDINAINGTPSKGLMQVIDPTFEAYALPGYDNDIYDPVSNVAAAINYMINRYGSIDAVVEPRRDGWYGYKVGTREVPEDMLAPIHEGEAILPKTQNPYSQSGGDYLAEIGYKISAGVQEQVQDSATPVFNVPEIPSMPDITNELVPQTMTPQTMTPPVIESAPTINTETVTPVNVGSTAQIPDININNTIPTLDGMGQVVMSGTGPNTELNLAPELFNTSEIPSTVNNIDYEAPPLNIDTPSPNKTVYTSDNRSFTVNPTIYVQTDDQAQRAGQSVVEELHKVLSQDLETMYNV